MAMEDAKIGEILEPGDAERQKDQARRVRESFWSTVKRAARHVPFMEDVIAAYYCAFDPQTPPRVRGTLLAALAYFVLPFDFLPDFIALIGFSDDLAVLAAAIAAIRNHIKPSHYAAARQALEVEPDGSRPAGDQN